MTLETYDYRVVNRSLDWTYRIHLNNSLGRAEKFETLVAASFLHRWLEWENEYPR